jgi:pimeloyl-ACP methyl ester carboxylesterase
MHRPARNDDEKQDLRKVIDGLAPGRVILIGMSLGAAVALQEAADDSRVVAVVAADTFSDLRTVARERAPRIMPEWSVRAAFAVAEERGRFRVDDVSPVDAAARMTVPVLVLHSALDRETSPDHSRRVFNALHGRKQLMLVEGAHHSQSLRADTWPLVERWLDEVLIAPNHI